MCQMQPPPDEKTSNTFFGERESLLQIDNKKNLYHVMFACSFVAWKRTVIEYRYRRLLSSDIFDSLEWARRTEDVDSWHVLVVNGLLTI